MENRILCKECRNLMNPPSSSWGDVCSKCGEDFLVEVEIGECPEPHTCLSEFHDDELNIHVYPI